MLPEQNPKLPDHINNPDTKPLTEFGKLVAGTAVLIATVIIVITFSINLLAPYIPFKWEPGKNMQARSLDGHEQALSELQQLADELASTMHMPDDMHITVHLVDGPPNAFAMLGGNIFITTGLLQSVQSENGLAMVMAHELAHLKHRDPITALGRGVAVSVVIAAITGSDVGAESLLVSSTGNLALLNFNRSMESRADEVALKQIVQRYGHSRGAAEFFQYALQQSDEQEWQALLSTHPLSSNRIKKLKANEHAFPQRELTPLSQSLKAVALKYQAE